MLARGNSIRASLGTWPWLTWAAGLCIVMASLAHCSPDSEALNYFDPAKRLLWALAGFLLAGTWSTRASRLDGLSLSLCFGLLAWMAGRTLARPVPAAEIEVLFTWMLPLVLFLLASAINHEREMVFMGCCLVGAGAIQACLMLLQRAGFDPLFGEVTSAMAYQPGRMIGTIGFQNQAVDFLALSAAGIFMVTRKAALRFLFLLVMLLVAGFTGNRSGIVALSCSILVSHAGLIWRNSPRPSRWKRLAAAGAMVCLCAVLATVLLIPDTGARFREIVKDLRQSPSLQSRVTMARVGFDMIQANPWIGWGAGEYALQYVDRLGRVLPAEKTHAALKNTVFARETHNDYLQFAAEFGVIGVVLMSSLVAVMALRMYRARSMQPGPTPAFMYLATYMGISSLFTFAWQTSMGGPLAGFALGLAMPHHVTTRHGDDNATTGLTAALRPMPKPVLALLTAVLVAWFSLDGLLNSSIPSIISRDGPAAAEVFLPGFVYRYHAAVGAALAAQGEYPEAERALDHARRGYCDIVLLNNLGNVKAGLLKWREAVAVYEEWAHSGLEHGNALMNLSIAYEQAGLERKAAHALLQRERLFRDLTPSQIKRLAVLQFRSGDPGAAQSILKASMRRWQSADSPVASEIENLAGVIALSLGQKDEAAKWFTAALERNPQLESASRNLQILTNRPHQPREAESPQPK